MIGDYTDAIERRSLYDDNKKRRGREPLNVRGESPDAPAKVESRYSLARTHQCAAEDAHHLHTVSIREFRYADVAYGVMPACRCVRVIVPLLCTILPNRTKMSIDPLD